MNSIKNPFAPGAGTRPPALVGRDDVLEQSQILLARIRHGRSEKSILLTGLRGVGKTILLNEIEWSAKQEGYHGFLVESNEDQPLSALLAAPLRKVLYDLDRLANAGDKVRRALAVLGSFISTIKVNVNGLQYSIGIEPEKGTADSGDLATDLPELLTAVAEAAAERGSAVAILIDEIQYSSKKELSALIMGMHRMQQRSLPLVLVGAGLPTLPGLVGESKSYAERLFSFPEIDALDRVDTAKALQEAVFAEDVRFTDEALAEIFDITRGYPYFVQECGYQAWNQAEKSPISLATVQAANAQVTRRLDQSFFRVRFDRLTPKEKQYLRAMAELDAEPRRTGDIADLLSVKITSLSPIRNNLIKKGMIYGPTHGVTAFTVPLFDQFMLRNFSLEPLNKNAP